MNLSQEAIDLLEAMLAERLEMMQMLDPHIGFNYYCDSCGDADCNDDNCRGRDWERENPQDRYGSYDDHDRYMWLDSSYDTYDDHEPLYGGVSDDWETYYDSVYN